MGRIITPDSPLWPNRAIKPPYGAAEIDWAHPLARGLTGYWLFNEWAPLATRNLVVPQKFALVSGSAVGTPYYGSRGILFNGGWAITANQNTELINTVPCTLMASARSTSDTQGAIICLGTSAGTNYGWLEYNAANNCALSYMRVGAAGATCTGTTNSWTDTSVFHLVTHVSLGLASHQLYFDGALSGSSTTNLVNPLSALGSTNFGSRRPTSLNVQLYGEIEWAATYNGRALTAAEQLALKADPWQILRPVIRRSYGFVGGGTGPTAKTGTDAFWLELAEAIAGAGAASQSDPILSALADVYGIGSSGTSADALAAILAESQSLAGAIASADIAQGIVGEQSSIVGVITPSDIAQLILAEAQSSTGAVTTSDILYADLQEAFSGTATGTTLDAIAAVIAESYSKAEGGAVPYAVADVLAAFLEEAHTGSATIAATDHVQTVLMAMLSGVATVTVNDLAAAIVADALAVVGTATSADELSVVLADAYSLIQGLASYASTDTLTVAVEEAHTLDLTAAYQLSDVLVAGLAERLAGSATVTVSDDLLARLTEAVLVDGAITAADALPAVLSDAYSIPLEKTSADALSLILADSGVAVGIQAITPFITSVLVVTWPVRRMVHATDGWPYTLVQKAA